MELLGGAKLSTEAAAKSSPEAARRARDPQGPSLLGEFLEPLLGLQVDPAAAVRRRW